MDMGAEFSSGLPAGKRNDWFSRTRPKANICILPGSGERARAAFAVCIKDDS
jgi:hypothetical protein